MIIHNQIIKPLWMKYTSTHWQRLQRLEHAVVFLCWFFPVVPDQLYQITQQPTEIKRRTRKVKPTWFLNCQSQWWRAQIDGKSSSWLSSSLLTFHGRFDWLESILFDWFCEDFGEFVELLIVVAMKNLTYNYEAEQLHFVLLWLSENVGCQI